MRCGKLAEEVSDRGLQAAEYLMKELGHSPWFGDSTMLRRPRY